MFKNTSVSTANNYFLPGGALIWQRLHSERENVCGALLNQSIPVGEATMAIHEMEPVDEAIRDVERKRIELLQTRLCRLDDALDRLMSGSYGLCCECGKQIDPARMAQDPAASYCVSCQRKMEEVLH